MADRIPEPGEYLICPNLHGGEKTRLEEMADDYWVECPDCDFTSQNFLKYPVAAVIDRKTGLFTLKNVLTGEKVTDVDGYLRS